GPRHWYRDRARRPRTGLRRVPAGRQRPRPLAGRDGSRAHAHEALRGAARRADLGRERARERQHVLVHHPRPADGACAVDVQGWRMTDKPNGDLILIVEDNEKNMKLTRDILQYHGFATVEATTGEDGVALAASRRPALILMDIQLPGIDGVTAFSRIRGD